MGLIIWYKIKIEEAGAADVGLVGNLTAMVTDGLPLSVSNDVYSGQYILDADITLTMKEGASASQFLLKMANLPVGVVETLKSKHSEAVKGGSPLQVKIYLGYFEKAPTFTSPDPVMTGSITRLKVMVDASGLLVTEIEGQESAGYKLRHYCDTWSKAGPVNIDTLVSEIAKNAGDVKVAGNSMLNLTWPNFTSRAANGLEALKEIAKRAKKPLVIRDNTIFLGSAVGSEEGPVFDSDVNLVQMDEDAYNEEIRETPPAGEKGKKKNTIQVQTRSSYEVKVLGEPNLRVGQKIKLKIPDPPSGTLRTSEVKHIFSTEQGYTCQVRLVIAEKGELAVQRGGTQAVVDRFLDVSKESQDKQPAVEVGEVKDYTPGKQGKHVTTLYCGQSAPIDAVSPSVDVEVNQDTELHDKPFVSPFAWHNCGLMLPVYPMMRALIVHNHNLVNDALVAGFLWPEEPAYTRPQNEAGDYWLCLPTELDSNGLPTKKGVNDLTDATGLRVIQAKGLLIQVGANSLPNVGVRPGLPNADEITIEHSSGTKITIASDGALKIETPNKDLTLTNGSVNLKLSGSAVEVS